MFLSQGLQPRRTIEINPQRLLEGTSHFNNSILAYKDKILMSYRLGFNCSRIGICELDRELQPTKNYLIDIPTVHPWSTYGREDLRLFEHQGELYGSYIGLGEQGANQMLCKFDDHLKIIENWNTEYSERLQNEKNWQFFSYGDELYCVYSIIPHTVLKGLGNGKFVKAFETTAKIEWSNCYLRGGAPPVRDGDYYYHFFHITVPPGRGFRYKRYLAGCYVFIAKPPFTIQKIIPGPIIVPNRQERVRGKSSVVFPCGAIKIGDEWYVSYGYHDAFARIAVFAENDLLSKFSRVQKDRVAIHTSENTTVASDAAKIYNRGIALRKRILARKQREEYRAQREIKKQEAKRKKDLVQAQRIVKLQSTLKKPETFQVQNKDEIREVRGVKGMGVLADWQIKEEIKIEPFSDQQIFQGVISYGVSGYGYDFRLGRKFKIFTNARCAIVDPKNFDPKSFVEHEGDHCLIPPNSFALGESLERVRIPRDIITICVGKSTYARCGIIVNVTPLEPEWEGVITIEISNTTPLPAKVYAEEGILQAMFLRADVPSKPCITSYADKKGKYQNQSGLTLPFVKS